MYLSVHLYGDIGWWMDVEEKRREILVDSIRCLEIKDIHMPRVTMVCTFTIT